MFNVIDGNFNDVAIRTFKVDLPTEHDLRKSLTRKLARNVSSWTVLMNISDSRKTNSKEKERLRLSFRI